jgi:hypothetical protein
MTTDDFLNVGATCARAHRKHIEKSSVSPVSSVVELNALADRVRRLRPPGHRDPEMFWREKSEIAHALEMLASPGRR